ncbi:hypothetical protein C0Q70_01529 [Pomacea canaliculata]|uniref:Uncharacterized protein n=2 Tax=Pomacea canaliculata TaxID=400727 RepID=A0A2T7PZQ4_POMCA|nr:hypothetical protein C0Q70_01529 [Pomacea canaliculata]
MTTGQSTSSLSSSNVTTAGGVTNPSGQTATSTSQSSQPPDSTLTHESSTAAVTSNNTEAPTTAAPATPEPTTTPATTPAPTTPAPTTVAPPPNSQTVNPDASFLLTIDVGPDKNVSCTDCNSSYVVEAFKAAFQSIPGFLYIDNVVTSAPTFRVNIRFFGSQFRTLNTTERQQSIWDALVNINNTEGLFVLDSARKIAEAFALTSDSLCNTERACSLGFRCTSARCVHMCEGYSCGDHGTCSLTISPDGEASPTCICNSDDETTYSGEYCQDSKISQRKVAAIVGGVLGAFCGLFIIIIIIMCCRQRESSSTK